jgi:hypothetical protein
MAISRYANISVKIWHVSVQSSPVLSTLGSKSLYKVAFLIHKALYRNLVAMYGLIHICSLQHLPIVLCGVMVINNKYV